MAKGRTMTESIGVGLPDPPDKDCYTLPNGDCITDDCPLHPRVDTEANKADKDWDEYKRRHPDPPRRVSPEAGQRAAETWR